MRSVSLITGSTAWFSSSSSSLARGKNMPWAGNRSGFCSHSAAHWARSVVPAVQLAQPLPGLKEGWPCRIHCSP